MDAMALTRREVVGLGCAAAASLAVAGTPLGMALAAPEIPVELDVTSYEVSEDGKSIMARIEATNSGEDAYCLLKAEVKFYDSDGFLLAMGEDVELAGLLEPGKTASYEVAVPLPAGVKKFRLEGPSEAEITEVLDYDEVGLKVVVMGCEPVDGGLKARALLYNTGGGSPYSKVTLAVKAYDEDGFLLGSGDVIIFDDAENPIKCGDDNARVVEGVLPFEGAAKVSVQGVMSIEKVDARDVPRDYPFPIVEFGAWQKAAISGPNPSPSGVVYADGEYVGTGKGIGGKFDVTVVVKGGKVAEVKVGDNSETAGIGTKAIEKLPAAIVEANGLEGVEGISGASVTSGAIFSAVEAALEQVAVLAEDLAASAGEAALAAEEPAVASGPEPIEWLVLDQKGSRKLLLAQNGIDCKPYNEEYVDTCWADCTLREWLNGEFLGTAFTAEEQAKIAEALIANDDNPDWGTDGGPDTSDRVFCLSLAEVEKYFGAKSGDTCEDLIAFSTDHAVQQGAYVDEDTGGCRWWLRSPGGDARFAANVYADGFVCGFGDSVDYDAVAVRPALWVSNL